MSRHHDENAFGDLPENVERWTAKRRVAVVSTNVIQHFPPLYRALALHPEVEPLVIYASKAGLTAYRDAGFGVDVAWDSDLTSGYAYQFLPGAGDAWRASFLGLRGEGIESCLDAFGPDAVFLFGYTPMVMLRALIYARRRALPAVMMCDSELLHHRPLLTRLAKGLILPPILRQFSAFMSIGDNNEAYLRHYGVPRSKILRGGYPTDEPAFFRARQHRAALREQVRRRWGIDPDAFVGLCVGKLIERKRPGDLIDALALLRSRTERPVHVVFAGDGPLRAELEARARQLTRRAVVFEGFISQKALPETYAAADVLLHPADHDPHPLTVTEAILVGLPVVVSDRVGAVGPTDTARPGANAQIYPAGDIQRLAGILEHLANNPEEVRRMGEASLDVARETGLDAVVRGFVAAVTSAVREAEKRRDA